MDLDRYLSLCATVKSSINVYMYTFMMLSKNKKKSWSLSPFCICLVFLFTLFFFLSLNILLCLYVCIFCERINYQLTNVRSQCVLSIQSLFFLFQREKREKKVIDKVYERFSFFFFFYFFLFGREKKWVIDRQMLTFFNLRERKSKPLKLTDESDQLSFL
jgi:hypothetical protein